jgi:ferredoxin
MKIFVDPARCRGHARCLSIAPEAFEFLDLEDRSAVVDGAADHTDLATLRAAEMECPERAIILETSEDQT